MVDSILATNSPNGSVGVYSWVRNAESERYSPGIITGFAGKISGMSYLPAGSSYNVCLAANASGDRDIFTLNTADNSAKVTLTAPTTQGQGRCYAIVAYRLAAEKATQNNGIGTVHFIAVAGGDTTQGTEHPPTEAAIRNAITGGATAYICVVAIISVWYGNTSINQGSVNARLSRTTVPINGSTIPGFQLRSIPTDHPVVLASSVNRNPDVWNTIQWSDGRLEMWGKFMEKGDFPFHEAGTWHMATVPVTQSYPIPLVASSDGMVHAVRTANLVGSRTGYVSPVYVHHAPPSDTFGNIVVLDFNNLVINDPEFALSVKGFWF